MLNNCQNNQNDNIIRVSNITSPGFLIRFRGTCTFPDIVAEFVSLPFKAGEFFEMGFPAYAAFTLLTIEKFDSTTHMWSQVSITGFSFPGSFCFNVSGSLSTPQLSPVPCTIQNNSVNNMCFNSIIQQLS